MNTPSAPVIAATGLSVRHDGADVLTAVDLEVPASAIMLLLGGEGAGKSALLRALIGVERASAGTIRLFGGADRDLAEGRAQSAYIPSQAHGLARRLSVGQLMRYHATYARRWDRDLAFDLANRFSLSDVQPIIEMSASRQSLTFLLLALAQRPSLLLWDNPRPAFDDPTRLIALSALMQYVQGSGAAVVLAETKVPVEIESAINQVMLLHHGHAVLSEQSEALRDRFRWYHLLRHAADEARTRVTLPVLLESQGGGRETQWMFEGEESAVIASLESSGLAVANVSTVSLPEAVLAHRSKLGLLS